MEKYKGNAAAVAALVKYAQSLEAENDRLRAAIRWALGEVADADGKWFGDAETMYYLGRRAPFGWRRHLRKIAGLPVLSYDQEKRTIEDNSGRQAGGSSEGK